VLCAKQEAGSETQLTITVLVLAKIVGQFKIIESFGLKPVSHLTVTIPSSWINRGITRAMSRISHILLPKDASDQSFHKPLDPLLLS
jgi:hypothetical protein